MSPDPVPTGKRVLIVDDTQDILLVVARRLKSWGYEALTASSGEAGLRLAQEHIPDLILLDIMMPKMKGRDVAAKLKADPKTAKIPIIFLTALGLADHIKAGLDLGADDYIVKPFEPGGRLIPIIFLTALGLADHIKAGLDLGADDYIVKPFEPGDLKERITVVLARHEKDKPAGD